MQAWLNNVYQGYKTNRLRKKLKDQAYLFLFEPAIEDEYICFDCETTGLNPKQDKIISLSAIKIKGNQVLTSQSLNLLIRQDKKITAESIVVHQIRNQDVREGGNKLLDEKEAITQFLHFIAGGTLVGYFLEFDVAMVNQVIKPWLGITLPNPKIEVSERYYQKVVRSQGYAKPLGHIDLRFETILKKLDIPNIGQHDAFSDALMTALIFVKLQRDS